MGEKPFDLAVYIGRFQPFHRGHRRVVERAVELSDNVLILVGSAFRARSWKDPWTYPERRAFILEACAGLDAEFQTLPLVDTLYSDSLWATNVRTAVRVHLRRLAITPTEARIILVGCEKDATSAYVRWFPELELEQVAPVKAGARPLNATDLRLVLFGEAKSTGWESFGRREVDRVQRWMEANPDTVAWIKEEGAFIEAYRAKLRGAEAVLGYPIPINTVDGVIVCAGHALLIERGERPGKGLMALPGGHINPDETALEACVREVYEEARLDMPKGALMSRLRGRKVFDHPYRSTKGWVRTEAFYFELENRGQLEKIKPGSDAARAVWVPLAEISPAQLFEDHFDIIADMTKEVPFAYSSLLHALQGTGAA